MVMDFNKSARDMVDEINELLQEYRTGTYPGQKTLNDAVKLIRQTTTMDKVIDVFRYVREYEDDYLDFAEDYEPIKAFFRSEQRDIWEKSQYYIQIFEDSQSYVVNEEIEAITGRMKEILEMKSPYDNIKDLPELNEKFLTIYNQILNDELEPVKFEIKEAEKRVMEELERTELQDVFDSRFKQTFKRLIDKAESCNNVAKVNGCRLEADSLKIRFLNEIYKEQERRAKKIKEEAEKRGGTTPSVKIEEPKPKRRRNISIKDITPSRSWQIESQDDVDRYLRILRERLESELDENTILNVEF